MVFQLFRSLLLTALLSFATPIFLVGALLIILWATCYLPAIGSVAQLGTNQILDFLAVFGSGYPTQGILIIGFTWGTAGALFELLNFRFYQSLRNH